MAFIQFDALGSWHSLLRLLVARQSAFDETRSLPPLQSEGQTIQSQREAHQIQHPGSVKLYLNPTEPSCKLSTNLVFLGL